MENPRLNLNMEAQGRKIKTEKKPKLTKFGMARVENGTSVSNTPIPIRPAPTTNSDAPRVNLNLPFINMAQYNANNRFGHEAMTSAPSSGTSQNMHFTQKMKSYLGQASNQSIKSGKPLKNNPNQYSILQNKISAPTNGGMPKNTPNQYAMLQSKMPVPPNNAGLPKNAPNQFSMLQSKLPVPPNSIGIPKNSYLKRNLTTLNDSSGHPALNTQCGPIQRMDTTPGRLQQIPRQPNQQLETIPTSVGRLQQIPRQSHQQLEAAPPSIGRLQQIPRQPLQRLDNIPTPVGRLQQLPHQAIPKGQIKLNTKKVQNLQVLKELSRPSSSQSLKPPTNLIVPKEENPEPVVKTEPQMEPQIRVQFEGLSYNNRNLYINSLRTIFQLYASRVKSKDLKFLVIVNQFKALCMFMENTVFPDFVARFIPRLLEVKSVPFEFVIKETLRTINFPGNSAMHITQNEVNANSIRMALAFKDQIFTPPKDNFNVQMEFSLGQLYVKIAPSELTETKREENQNLNENQGKNKNGIKKELISIGIQTLDVASCPGQLSTFEYFARQQLITMAKLNSRQKRFEALQNDYIDEGIKLKDSVVDIVSNIQEGVGDIKDLAETMTVFIEHSSQKQKASGKMAKVSRKAQTEEISFNDLIAFGPGFLQQKRGVNGKRTIAEGLTTIINYSVKTLSEMEKELFMIAQERDRVAEENYELKRNVRRKKVIRKAMTQTCKEVIPSAIPSSRTSRTTGKRCDMSKSAPRKPHDEKGIKRKREESTRSEESYKRDDRSSQKIHRERSSDKDSKSFRKHDKPRRSSEDHSYKTSHNSEKYEEKTRRHRSSSEQNSIERPKKPKVTIKKEYDSEKRELRKENDFERNKIFKKENESDRKSVKREHESGRKSSPAKSAEPPIKPPIYLLSPNFLQFESPNGSISTKPNESTSTMTSSSLFTESSHLSNFSQQSDGHSPHLPQPTSPPTIALPSKRPIIIPDDTFPVVETQAFISSMRQLLEESTFKIKLITNEHLVVGLEFRDSQLRNLSNHYEEPVKLSEFQCEDVVPATSPEEYIERCKNIACSINVNFKEVLEEEEGFQEYIQNPDQYLDSIDIGGLKLEPVEPPPILEGDDPDVKFDCVDSVFKSDEVDSAFKVEEIDHDQPPGLEIEISDVTNAFKPEYY